VLRCGEAVAADLAAEGGEELTSSSWCCCWRCWGEATVSAVVVVGVAAAAVGFVVGDDAVAVLGVSAARDVAGAAAFAVTALASW